MKVNSPQTGSSELILLLLIPLLIKPKPNKGSQLLTSSEEARRGTCWQFIVFD